MAIGDLCFRFGIVTFAYGLEADLIGAYSQGMKVITVSDAAGRLPEIIYAVTQGEYVVLKDGDREVTLTPRIAGEFDLDEDSAELEAELLKAADGPFRPYAPENLDKIAQRVVEKRRQ